MRLRGRTGTGAAAPEGHTERRTLAKGVALIARSPLQLHQQNHQQYQSPHQLPHQPPHEAPRAWKSPSPAPQHEPWAPQQPQPPQPQAFVLREREAQPFQIHYAGDRYQNGDAPNHLSYTVAHEQFASPQSSPRRARTPQRPAQGSAEGRRLGAEPVSLQQLQTPVAAPPPADMEPQNISFIGSAEADALRQGIDRLHISSGTRTYRIPSPTRPSLGRNSFQRPERDEREEEEEEEERAEKGFYISFDNDQPKRPKPPLRAKRGSPRKEPPSAERSPERGPEREPAWPERLPRADQPFAAHRAPPAPLAPPRRSPPRAGAEPAALVVGEVHVDPVGAITFPFASRFL